MGKGFLRRRPGEAISEQALQMLLEPERTQLRLLQESRRNIVENLFKRAQAIARRRRERTTPKLVHSVIREELERQYPLAHSGLAARLHDPAEYLP